MFLSSHEDGLSFFEEKDLQILLKTFSFVKSVELKHLAQICFAVTITGPKTGDTRALKIELQSFDTENQSQAAGGFLLDPDSNFQR